MVWAISESTLIAESIYSLLAEWKHIFIVHINCIRNFGDELEDITGSASSDGKETTINANVHTDTNSAQCLEEAVRYVDYIVGKVKCPDGSWAAMWGPVFSYHEFKQPINNRLTDEEWKDRLKKGGAPPQTLWVW